VKCGIISMLEGRKILSWRVSWNLWYNADLYQLFACRYRVDMLSGVWKTVLSIITQTITSCIHPPSRYKSLFGRSGRKNNRSVLCLSYQYFTVSYQLNGCFRVFGREGTQGNGTVFTVSKQVLTLNTCASSVTMTKLVCSLLQQPDHH